MGDEGPFGTELVGRLSGDAGMWFDSALRRLRAGSP